MKFIINGNITLEDYMNTNHFEEMILFTESVYNESVADLVYTEETIATEGLFGFMRNTGKAVGSAFKISSTIAKTGVEAATLGSKKLADVLKILNNQIQNNMPKLIAKLQRTLENTESLYMRLTKYDNKFLEVAQKMSTILASKSYEHLQTVPTTTIRFYKVNGELFKDMIDLIGDYHLLCKRIVGLDFQSTGLTQISATDVLFSKNEFGELITPNKLMSELSTLRDGFNNPEEINEKIENMTKILEKAAESVSNYMKAFVSEGRNTILIRYVDKKGADGRLILKDIKDMAKQELKSNNKKKGVGVNPVKLALLPQMKSHTFDTAKWRDQRKDLISFINLPSKDGGMVDAFMLLVNGTSSGAMQKTTKSVLVDLIKKGGANVKKSTDALVKYTKKDIDELRSFCNKLADTLTKAEAGRAKENNKNVDNTIVSADTGVGKKTVDDKKDVVQNEYTARFIKVLNLVDSYLINWYAILERIGGFYSQISSGLLGCIFNITNEVSAIANMVESSSGTEGDNVRKNMESRPNTSNKSNTNSEPVKETENEEKSDN